MCNPKDPRVASRVFPLEKTQSMRTDSEADNEFGAGAGAGVGGGNGPVVTFQQHAAVMLKKRNSVIAETRMISYRDMDFARDSKKQSFYTNSRSPEPIEGEPKAKSRFEMMLSLL